MNYFIKGIKKMDYLIHVYVQFFCQTQITKCKNKKNVLDDLDQIYLVFRQDVEFLKSF